ncbi:hypothetical protein BREVNS_0880 [Brevinematales bacterium NS]|nr:hypothetical protein BREVNS_0880 [Brevinematales bacterium NS]
MPRGPGGRRPSLEKEALPGEGGPPWRRRPVLFLPPLIFSVPHFDFAQYPPGRFCGYEKGPLVSDGKVLPTGGHRRCPGRPLLLPCPKSPPKRSRGDPALAGNRRSKVGVLLPMSGGRVEVAHGGRTCPPRRNVPHGPQKRPTIRPRRMRSMRRGQGFS